MGGCLSTSHNRSTEIQRAIAVAIGGLVQDKRTQFWGHSTTCTTIPLSGVFGPNAFILGTAQRGFSPISRRVRFGSQNPNIKNQFAGPSKHFICFSTTIFTLCLLGDYQNSHKEHTFNTMQMVGKGYILPIEPQMNVWTTTLMVIGTMIYFCGGVCK